MSAMMPPALVMVLLPKVPAKKRNTSNVLRSLAPHTAAQKAVKGMYVMMNMERRPKISEAGAQSNGPTTNPRT